MECPASLIIALLSAIMVVGASAASLSLPENSHAPEAGVDEAKAMSQRATWLHTRQLEEEFKQLVGMAIVELVNEGTLSRNVLANDAQNAIVDKTKRSRWQGFCFRRTNSGRFLPYICWKGENDKK